MTDIARVDVLDEDDESVAVAVVGEVDASNAAWVLGSLESALTAQRLRVDLTWLEYVDSAGVRALYALAETAALRRVEVSLVVPDASPVRRVLDVAGIADVLAFESPATTG